MSHVLIIEDEMLIAMHLESLVADLGHGSVDLAATESEAVARAQHRRPSLILSDIRLQEGTGPAAVRAIRAAHGPIPVVYVTGNPEECPADLTHASVVAKPVQDQQLGATIRAVLASAFEEHSPAAD
jgi:two-component system, response regulator PdtaR